MYATVGAALLAVAVVSAQYGVFAPPSLEGQIWHVIQTLASPGASPVGLTYAGGSLYVGDNTTKVVAAYHTNGAPLNLTDPDWGPGKSADSSSPMFGVVPLELATGLVRVDTAAPAQAIFLSDHETNRVLVFTTAGKHLFTLRLNRGVEEELIINTVAMGPGSQFNLTTTGPTKTLTLAGKFAAVWAGQEYGGVDGAVLVYEDRSFDLIDGEFTTAPSHTLTGDDGDYWLPAPFGVAFDTAGNLYTIDSIAEQVHAYDPAFNYLFTFGVPDPINGGTDEFSEPYGMVFQPDSSGPGGRLVIAEVIGNRISVFRPDLANATLNREFVLEGFFSLEPFQEGDGQPRSVAINSVDGRLATSDIVAGRVWVLQKPSLAAYNLQVLDTNGAPTDVVCNGASYQVRFSLTVPPNRPPVGDITPRLNIDGALAPSSAQPPNYPVNPPLNAGDTLTYTYSLTAPGAPFFGDVVLSAGAVTPQTPDVLFQATTLSVSDCPAGNAAPILSWTPSIAKQLSGWTAVPDDQTFVLKLRADDDTRVVSMHYEISGMNDTGLPYPVIDNPAPSSTWQGIDVPLGDPGDTTVTFKARDNNLVWSATQDVDLRLVRVSMKISNEGEDVEPFSFGAPFPGSGVTYSATGLDALGWSIDTATGVMSGPPLSHGVGGDHIITVTESRGAQTTSASFTWRVTNDNRGPVANNDNYSTNEDTPLTVNAASGLLDNDTDADDDELTGIETSFPLGVLALQPDGAFQYTPPPNFNGSDSFSYIINDGFLYSTATVTITVNSVNDAPSFTRGADQTVTEDAGPQTVTAWATDISAGPPNESAQMLTFVVTNSNTALFSAPPAIAPNGTLTYKPASNAFGNATVTVTLKDNGASGNGHVNTSAEQTFRITVNPANDPPVAVPDSANIVQGASVTIAVLTNDIDVDGGPLSVTAHTLPSAGTLVLAGNVFTYTAPVGFVGPTSFTYTVSDGVGGSASGTVAITVLPPATGCVIVDFREITYFKGERVIMSSDAGIRTRNRIPGLFNPAVWPYSASASATSTTATKSRGTLFRLYGFKPGELGHLVRNADNPAIVYPVLLDPAIAGAYYIDMLGPARVSVCPEQLHNYALDTLNLPGDMPGTAMLPAAQRNVPGVMLSHNTQIVRLPDHIQTEMEALGLDPTNKGLIDYVGYQLQGYGSAAFKEFVDVQFSWAEDSATDRAVHFAKGFHTAMTHDLEGSVSCDYLDSAAGDDAMRLRDFWGFSRRSGMNYAAWQACGSKEPAANQKKRANYVVPFNAVQILPTVNINVDTLRMFYGEIRRVIENRAPSAGADTATVARGATAYIAVLANDTDPDGDALTVTAVTAPSKGSAVVTGNGTTITYTAPSNFTGTTSFTYKVSDGKGGTATATVTVSVTNSSNHSDDDCGDRDHDHDRDDDNRDRDHRRGDHDRCRHR